MIEETSNAKSVVCMVEDVDVKSNANVFLALLGTSFLKGNIGEVYFTLCLSRT